MATECLVVALGGGRGHLTRALNFAATHAATTTILASPGATSPVAPRPGVTVLRVSADRAAEDVRAHLGATRASWLVVDTFPGGLFGELGSLAGFAKTTLIRRYLRPGAYPDEERLAARYDEVLLPYSPERCEWDRTQPGVHVGPLVRPLAVGTGPRRPWVVLGPVARFAPWALAALPPDTVYLSGPVDLLPLAERYLAVGGGHNLTYELLALGVPFRVVPTEQRYDDPFRRADRLGVFAPDRRALLGSWS